MRKLILLVGLALAVGVLIPGSGLGDVGGSNLQLKGSQSGYCDTNFLTGESECVTTGPVSHLGLMTLEQVIDAAPGPGPTYSWSGDWASAAASGDQIFGTAAGSITFDPDGIHATSVGTYTSSGGTGRLEDASSTFEATAKFTLLSFDPLTFMGYSYVEVTAKGTLSH